MKRHFQDIPASQKQGFAFNYPDPMPPMLNPAPHFCNHIPNQDPDAMDIDVYSTLGTDGQLNNAEKAC